MARTLGDIKTGSGLRQSFGWILLGGETLTVPCEAQIRGAQATVTPDGRDAIMFDIDKTRTDKTGAQWFILKNGESVAVMGPADSPHWSIGHVHGQLPNHAPLLALINSGFAA